MTKTELLCVMASNIAAGLGQMYPRNEASDALATEALTIALEINHKVEKNNVNARKGE